MGRVKRKINWSKIKWGALTAWLKRHRKSIERVFGKDPFTKTGEINDNVLRMMAAKKNREKLKKVAPRSWKHALKMILFKLNVLNKRHGG